MLFFVSCHQSNTLFTELPASKTNIQFVNTLKDKHLFSILYYLYYYNGGGVATGDINNDGLPDIYFTANSKGNNKLYLNKGNFQFEDITDKAVVAGSADWCTGVSMVDMNSDGYLDIYVSAMAGSYGLKGHNELFVNNKNGTFTESAAKYGLDYSGHTTQTGFFDYDHDGDMDCYILNQSQKPHANIVDTINRHKYDSLSGDRFYRNDVSTTGKFTDVSAAAGIYQSNLGYGLGLAMADFNNDGWEDIYIGNDFHENDYYYINNGNGTFTESGEKHFRHYSRFSMGNDAADYNNDGQIDLVTVDMLPQEEKVLKTYGSDENPDTYKIKLTANGYQHQSSKNCLQHNNGNGSSFSETSLISGVSATDWSWCPLFADFDNDGNKDLFISSGIVKRPVDMDYIRFVSDLSVRKGMNETDKFDAAAIEKMPDGSSHPFLYKGSGSYSFKDVSDDWGTGKMKGYFNGAAYADLDNDGNLDLLINCINAPAVVLKNNAPKKNYIAVSFKADSGNTFGIGCKAYLFQKGKMQYQQLMLTRGFESSSDTRLHFGLDSLPVIDSLLIVWPNQQYQLLKNVAANQQLVLQQKNAAGVFDYNVRFPKAASLLEEQTAATNINWRHRENDFNDFDYQYLLPHAESTRGPKIAVADVNGDGLDDIYTCAAKGQPGTLFIQQSNGSFIQSDSSVFNKDAGYEDVDAIFFDANGDAKPDLCVVSGGNEFKGETDPALLDRLYLNDGKGHFIKGTNNLPALFKNKSCVTSADVDHDGDVDLFVGTLADPSSYGIPQTSYLLINDGKANFTVAPNNDFLFKEIGLVTTASFTDINKDGWQDLVVTGEFMSINIFINNNGKLVKNVLPQSTGMWQTVFMDDVNGDGNMDILAGNWGWNNKFWSGKNGPVKMYVADFDKNGRTEQLLSYTLNSKEYPFLAKDEVERPLPLLKKHYLMYAEYAGEEMKDVFYGWIDTIKPVMAEHLGSVVCYGDGKGNFIINDLPQQLQLAPIFSFQKIEKTADNSNMYLAGGNFFDVIPYEGRYDAQPLALFTINNKKEVKAVAQQNLSSVKGQVRDMKWISGSSGKTLLVARNNDQLMSFRKK
ncbi:MAG: VCBS repeat-containing protein [Chitinophagaceae bacterium]|nr:VCBS repeat-containing protein [Chitinophagaceae bacterium]